MSAGATSYGYQNWTSDKEKRNDVTNRYFNYRRLHTLLRKCYGCSFEHLKIQNQGCRLLGQIDEHADHPTLLENNRTGFQNHEYSNTCRKCHLFVHVREGQSPGERNLRLGTTSKTMNTLCAHLFYYPRYDIQHRFSRHRRNTSDNS